MSNSFVTPWTIAYQASLSIGFPRQEYWSGFPFPSPGDRPGPGIEPASSALSGGFFTTEPLKPWFCCCTWLNGPLCSEGERGVLDTSSSGGGAAVIALEQAVIPNPLSLTLRHMAEAGLSCHIPPGTLSLRNATKPSWHYSFLCPLYP